MLKSIVQRAVELGWSDEAQVKKLFPERDGKDDPLWSVVTLGDQVPLDVYAALDENHVWSLISRWRTHGDPVLSDLGDRIKKRRLPKVLVPEEGISKLRLKSVEAYAKKAFEKRFKDRDSKYYIGIDEPSRMTYHQSAWEDDDYVALKLITGDGRLHRIEDDKHSIATVLKQKVYYPSLILPDEIRAEVKAYMGDLKP